MQLLLPLGIDYEDEVFGGDNKIIRVPSMIKLQNRIVQDYNVGCNPSRLTRILMLSNQGYKGILLSNSSYAECKWENSSPIKTLVQESRENKYYSIIEFKAYINTPRLVANLNSNETSIQIQAFNHENLHVFNRHTVN